MVAVYRWLAGFRRRRRWLLVAGGAAMLVSLFFLLPPSERSLVVRVDGAQRTIVTRAATLGQALQEAGVAVGPQDRVSVPLSSPLSSVTTVSIVRVQSTEELRRVVIPYSRQVTDDPQRLRGYREIIQAGSPGMKEFRELVITEDGREVERRIIDERVLQPPIAERMIGGARPNSWLDSFRETTLSYLGRGGVTRLSGPVVEQAVFELARLQGDRYGTIRVLTENERSRLVLKTFARTPDEAALLVFWWADELHAFGQVIAEGLYLLDSRAVRLPNAIELGLIVSPGHGQEAVTPQFLLLRLPLDEATQEPADTWRLVWSSQGRSAWHSRQGVVAFGNGGLDRLDVRGAASVPDESAGLTECAGCPLRRFESTWQRQGDVYVPTTQRVSPSPYATLWNFMEGLRSADVTGALPLVTIRDVISDGLRAGLGRQDLRWSTTDRETSMTFNLRSKESSIQVGLVQRGPGWLVSAVGPVTAQGRILFTGTRPVVRGLFDIDTSASAPPRALGDGQHYVWSPDYARLAYDWQGNVYVANSDGSNARLIAPGLWPAWSGDGKRLAFERPSGSGPRIVIVDLDSGIETVIAAGSRPAWDPVRSRLAFVTSSAGSPSSVYLVDVGSGSPALLASDGGDPLWSPDGAAIAFLTARQEIAVVTLTPARLTTIGPGWGYAWSPDGQSLAFLSSGQAGRPLAWDKASSDVKPLLDRDDIEGFSWSPDGRELVYSLAGGGGLWLAGRDGGNWRKLGDGRDPMWGWLPRTGR